MTAPAMVALLKARFRYLYNMGDLCRYLNVHIKFISVLAVVLFLTTSKSYAQSNYYDEPQPTFTGGLVAGMNFATIDDDEDVPYDKFGANLGGVVFTRLKQHLDISMEMLFSQKGEKTDQ